MANLPEVPERSELRSRTYLGVARAAAVQWMPSLMAHVVSSEQSPTRAADLVAMAEAGDGKGEVQMVFRRYTADGKEQLLVREDTGLPAFTGVCDTDDEDAASLTVLRSLRADAALPQAWVDAASASVRYHPSGSHRVSAKRGRGSRDVYFWIADLVGADGYQQPHTPGCRIFSIGRSPATLKSLISRISISTKHIQTTCLAIGERRRPLQCRSRVARRHAGKHNEAGGLCGN